MESLLGKTLEEAYLSLLVVARLRLPLRTFEAREWGCTGGIKSAHDRGRPLQLSVTQLPFPSPGGKFPSYIEH